MLPQDNGALINPFNNGLINRNCPLDFENGMLTKLRDDSPAPCKVIDENNIRGYPFSSLRMNSFFQCLPLCHLETLWF